MVRQHQEDDGQGQVVVVSRAELGLLAELRVGRATGQQFGDHLLLVRDDDEEDAGRHPGGDHRAGMEKGGTAVEDLGEGEGGKKDIDEERDAENDTVPAERRTAQALIDEPAHHDAADADGRRLPELEGADSRIDSVEIGVKVIDPDDEEEAADPGGIALPLEPGQFLRQFGRRNKVLAHVVEPAAMNLPCLAADAFRKAVPLLQAEIQVNEVEGRADPGDGGDHVGPADDLADPFGNLRVDHAVLGRWKERVHLAQRAGLRIGHWPVSRFFNRKSVPILRPFCCRCQPDGLTPGRQPERFQGLFPIRPYSLREVSWDACPPTFWILPTASPPRASPSSFSPSRATSAVRSLRRQPMPMGAPMHR